MNHLTVLLEHVDLLNCLDGLHVQLLQRSLQFLVICPGGLVHPLSLSTGRSLSSDPDRCSLLLESS
jgi:hypothetical protein